MPNYKDKSGALHFLDDASFEYLLPAGCTEISNEEAARIAEEIAKAGALPPVGRVPDSVSRFQARAALMGEGLLERVEAYIARDDVDQLVKLAWHEATEFRRKSLTVLMLSSVLGLTESDIDRLFIKAASIVV